MSIADQLSSITRLPLVALRGRVVLPGASEPLFMGRERSVASVQHALKNDKLILCVAQRDEKTDQPQIADLYEYATVVQIVNSAALPDGSIRILALGVAIVNLTELAEDDDLQWGVIDHSWQLDESETGEELEQLVKRLRKQATRFFKLDRKTTRTKNSLERLTPLNLGFRVLAHLGLSTDDIQALLGEKDVNHFLLKILAHLENAIDRLESDRKVKSRVKKQMETDQRDYYLNEQMKAIQKEMGGDDAVKSEMEELEAKIQEKDLPAEAREKVEKEFKKLKMMSPMGAEATVVRNYIEWILSIPWQSERSEEKEDIQDAQSILNADHYALKKPKERILEHLAVHSLTKDLSGPILCLVGPPGVGKTSLVRSIAKSTGREFVRMSLGGVRDEAEIRGHRRTYIGAMPGKIIQSLKKVGTSNPVLLLDEIDKMSTDFRGDPSSALLEVLDPEQNNTFNDHYLDLDYDLSQVMFITTANNRHQIPLPLQDRLEMIQVSGYTEIEKLNIAKRHLLPKQVERHGIKDAQITWGDSALKLVINRYTRESGVRNLERQIAALCRKITRDVITHKGDGGEISTFKMRVDTRKVQTLLGAPPYKFGVSDAQDEVGLVNGLAYTSWGGNLLQAEVTMMEGNGKLTITGQLGEVMQESARAAMSYVRTRALDLGLEPKFHQDHDFHLHFPEGAIPKDGPSAGVTMVTGLVSAIKGLPVRRDVAMTGEITLRGRVLPIGGLKEKLLAAKRGGIKTVFIPKENEKDLDEVPSSILRALEIVPVEKADDILQKTFIGGTPFVEKNEKVSSPKPKSGAKSKGTKKSTAKSGTATKSTAKSGTAAKSTAKSSTATKSTAKSGTATKSTAKSGTAAKSTKVTKNTRKSPKKSTKSDA
jgi:ATP-dependent Lon protease